MKTDSIKPKEGLQLRKIGKQYMIVDASGGNVNMCNVYSLNRTAARLWEQMADNGMSTLEELAAYLCANYEIDEPSALRDVERLLAEWRSFGLIVNI